MNLPEPIISRPQDMLQPKILINPLCRWRECDVAGGKLFYTGCGLEIAQEIASAEEGNIDSILNRQTNYSSGIFSFNGKIIVWVDHIRSFPVFYSVNQQHRIVSNEAQLILPDLEDKMANDVAALEFSMAGFVTGADTLYKNIKCLQPGEFLIYPASGGAPVLNRYYRYLPSPVTSSWEENRKKLSAVLDKIILKIISRANGRPIWVPLSAGLDSRIILCKLHEHGYKNLHTFTYGPKYNFEAFHAKRVAQKLCVPWHFIALSGKECRNLFESEVRKKYSNFSDNLKVAPNFQEFSALVTAQKQGLISSDSILINGQSGDYITGGHVAPVWYDGKTTTKADLFNVLVAKHYSLWQKLKTPENLEIIHRKIDGILPEVKVPAPFTQAAQEETWEYEARQVLLVINGQRLYDFLGYDWELPLWERSLCDLFEGVPYDQKRNQALFKDYLRQYDYKGLFASKEPKIWRWPLPMLWVVPAARIVGLIGSDVAKTKFYAFMRYFGHYSNQYAFFPFALHKATYAVTRNIFSLYVRHWFIENRFPLAGSLKDAMQISDSDQAY